MELLTTHQILTRGDDHHAIAASIKAGRLTRIARGHYVAGATTDFRTQHELQIAACADRMADDAVISHESAATLHGLPLPPGAVGPVRMIRPRRANGGGRGTGAVRVHRLDVKPDELTALSIHLRRIPATTIARTVIDLSCRSLPWGLAAADVALARGVSRAELALITEGQSGRTGIARARQVAVHADGRAESPAESLSRAYLLLGGVPQPELQHEIRDSTGRFVARCDFGWSTFKVVGECDGLAKYQDPHVGSVQEALRREKAREASLRDLGWEVVRWTYDEIFDLQKMARRVARALHRRGWSANSRS